MPYVIIGGDAAGMSAAMQIRKFHPDANIITLEKGEIYSYAQCGLPYVLNGEVESADDLVARDVETFRSKHHIDARINVEVTNVNGNKKIVSGKDTKTGEAFEISYGKLLIATGADPFIPDWEGANLQGVFQLKTIPDLQKIMARIEQQDIEQVTIIGGGYIGLEMAESFSMIGKKVRLINRSSHVANMFDTDMAELIHEEAKKQNIELRLNEDVEKIIGNEEVQSIVTNKGEYNTDLVLVATGIVPNTSFLKDTGVELEGKGAIKVNEFMETNVTDIYAAGDCAVHYNRVKQKNDYIPLGTTANKQGRIAGMNMAGEKRKFAGVVGTSVLRFFDLALGKTGLSEKEAAQLQLNYGSTVIDAQDRAGYFPNPQQITIKLVYDKEDYRLLGGQIIGKNGVDKRIDVLATALYNKMTMTELEDLDLSYSPPFNGVWDPIQRAARRSH